MESNRKAIEGHYQPLVLRLQTAVAHMAHHQRDRQNGRLLIECLDAIKTMGEINSRCCQEWAEDHTHLRALCRSAGCPELEIDGDNYGVPGIIDLINSLRDRLFPRNVQAMASAAPDMLEALQMLMPQEPREADSYDRAMWDAARAAIAKATGKGAG